MSLRSVTNITPLSRDSGPKISPGQLVGSLLAIKMAILFHLLHYLKGLESLQETLYNFSLRSETNGTTLDQDFELDT